MILSRKYRYLWIAWLSLFGIIEYAAWRDSKPGDTLSEFAWWIVGNPSGAVLLAIGFALLL